MDSNVVFPPFEERTVEIIGKNGSKQKVPAFNKNFAPDIPFNSFYLPRLESLTSEPSVFHKWEEEMGVYLDNIKFLLRLPHYKFWSSLLFSKAISDQVLSSYLLHAPRPHDPETTKYLLHPRIGPLILQIHGFIFRIFLRLSTIKETKEDHISASKWAMLVFGREFFATPKLLQLSLLFGPSHKQFLMEMMENILKNQPRLFESVCAVLPLYVEKWKKQTKELGVAVRQMNVNQSKWEAGPYEEILRVNLEDVVSFHKFLDLYPPIVTFAHGTPEFEFILALSYEQDVQQWKKVVQHLPQLEGNVNIWRVHMLKLFRLVLTTSTILSKNTPDGGAVDEFFGALSNCLELCIFLHDYERTFPFMTDINNLRRKGVHVDSTRVEYLSNAFEASFEACGQRYSSDTTGSNGQAPTHDLLGDPTFDRQLLGACSLDVVGPELVSLISQVKDLLPDLQDGYIEACLKHYGYQSETVINAILEGSVPTTLEKYKDSPPPKKVEKADQELLYRKNESTVDDSFLLPSSELKQRVLECYDAQETRKWTMGEDTENDYVAKSLLPSFREDAEYDDEYDDTYDETGVGMTEPDAMPLNPKLKPRYQAGESDEDDEPETAKGGGFEQFVEDPAIVRARMEQRRATQYRGHETRPQRDVVGRGKGQGQSAEVLLNRRRKDETGSHNRRKRADHKRREF